jgi:GNAT superfamily N-acetyltransferase
MRLRIMTESDIPAGMRLKEAAGWNQTEVDWGRFLRASERGCMVAEVDGQVRGTVATIIYDHRFAWVGMVLVDPEYRGKGLGTNLLEAAIQYLQEARVPTVKLDATPLGKPIYEKLGFQCEYEIERWILKRTPGVALEAPGMEVPQGLLKRVLEEDREVFGADRSQLLKSLHQDTPKFTLAICESGVLIGSAFGRRGSFADQLGPWIARDARAGADLLGSFMARSSREVLLVDRLKSSAIAGSLLQSLGFECSRPLTRMYRGPNDHPGQAKNLYAILGPEFG